METDGGTALGRGAEAKTGVSARVTGGAATPKGVGVAEKEIIQHPSGVLFGITGVATCL